MYKLLYYLTYPFGWMIDLLPELPEEKLWREHCRRIEEEARIASEKISAARRDVPGLAVDPDPDFLLSVIADRQNSPEARGEAYDLILGTTPAGQPKREPPELTDEQRHKLMELICSETDDTANIHFILFVYQDVLKFVFENAAVSEIRGRALYRMMQIERNLLLLERDIKDRITPLPDRIQMTEDERHLICEKMVRKNDFDLIFDLSSKELPSVLDDYLKNREISEMRGKIWKFSSQQELRDALVLAQKEYFERSMEYIRQELTEQGKKAAALMTIAKEKTDILAEKQKQIERLINSGIDKKDLRVLIRELHIQAEETGKLLSKIEEELEKESEIEREIDNYINERSGSEKYPHINRIIPDPWRDAIIALKERIVYHEPAEFLFELIRDPYVNDDIAGDFLFHVLIAPVSKELQDRAVHAYIHGNRKMDDLHYSAARILKNRYDIDVDHPNLDKLSEI